MLSKSRGPELDTQKCVAQVGGSKYDLILIAAARSREIRDQQRSDGDQVPNHTPVTALLEIQKGQVGREYLLKIRK